MLREGLGCGCRFAAVECCGLSAVGRVLWFGGLLPAEDLRSGGVELVVDLVDAVLVLSRGQLVEEVEEVTAECGGDAAGLADFVGHGAELLFVLLNGLHGVEQGVHVVEEGGVLRGGAAAV